MTETTFPVWFDAEKLAQQAPADLPLLRDALVRELALVSGALLLWADDPNETHPALLVTHIANVEGVAARLGANQLWLLADALRWHYVDAQLGRPSRDTGSVETMVADLLRECERTHLALGTTGRDSAPGTA